MSDEAESCANAAEGCGGGHVSGALVVVVVTVVVVVVEGTMISAGAVVWIAVMEMDDDAIVISGMSAGGDVTVPSPTLALLSSSSSFSSLRYPTTRSIRLASSSPI